MNSSVKVEHSVRLCKVAALGVLIIVGLCHIPVAAERTKIRDPDVLPFSASVTIRPLALDILSLNVDSPIRQVVINGEVWIFGAQPDPYHNPISVPRWKGPDFEHMIRQPDGAANFPQRTASSFINSGLWYDEATGTLFALMHGEYGHGWPGDSWCRKKTWLVSSRDIGLHWTFIGDVLTAALPSPEDRMKYSGSEYEMGPADFDLYVDTRAGYFYVTTWNGFVAKKGILNHFTAGTVEVARCAIGDKMAPGKWYKFDEGSWTEPGIGGKASRVGMSSYGIYGNTIYSTYLQKYLRIGTNAALGDPRFPNLGMRDGSIYISVSSDLSKQDWTPMAKLVDEPANLLAGFTLSSSDGLNASICGKTLHAYNYWTTRGRVLDITFARGALHKSPFPPYGSYSYEAHPESGDSIENRRTKIVGAAGPEMHYSSSGWNIVKDPRYYKSQINQSSSPGSTVEFSFRGPAIYWRAIAASDGGKADVYIDQQFQKTVDLYFWDSPLIFQFAFIKTGLRPDIAHTIKVVARSDKNAGSHGTVINHMAFEYGAESYLASAGFSSVSGKNAWFYQTAVGLARANLTFNAPSNCWLAEGRCIVGNNYQTPLENGKAIRTWVAPHDGNIRIEGRPARTGSGGDGFAVSVMRNMEELWSSQLILAQTESTSHDLAVAVRKGDEISLVAERAKIDPRKNKTGMSSSAELAPAAPAGNGDKLEVNGGIEEFECGMVCHAASDTAVALPAPGRTFSALVGVNTDTSKDSPSAKSAVFSVIVGGKTIFRTEALKAGTGGVPVNVELEGARGLVLEVSDGGEGIGLDWAKWLKPMVTLSDGRNLWLSDTLSADTTGNEVKLTWDPVVTYSSF